MEIPLPPVPEIFDILLQKEVRLCVTLLNYLFTIFIKKIFNSLFHTTLISQKPFISVIISTYNAEAWLEKVLWGYQQQTYRNFEVVIADDGSDAATKHSIAKLKKTLDFPIQHVWHPDNGFQKTIILNKAIKKAKGSYLVFSDGDCIPRKDFLAVHNANKTEGRFLSGGYFMLPMSISKTISPQHIIQQQCFDLNWLKSEGLSSSFKNNKISASVFLAKILNAVTPTKPTWNGHNASAYKKDILAVNGFDERMQYGGEDREMGERLMHNNVYGKQIRYSAICIHLDHARGYVNAVAWQKNNSIRKETALQRSTWTPFGIVKVNAS